MTPSEAELRERLRRIPAVDRVLQALEPDSLAASPALTTALVRMVVEEVRAEVRSGEASGTAPEVSPEALAARVRERFQELSETTPRPVINATGVLVHTNLGRSPLSAAAVEHMRRIAGEYSDLELDLENGVRGSRQVHVTGLLRLLTGAEDALVVNNNAAAVLLALAAMARDREVVVSRGELVEIGGSFRIPDVLAQSGARLKEVGTTNRTHPRDYEHAVGPDTGLLLKVHTSNYRVEGFTAEVPLGDLVRIGRERGVPVGVDLGSGALLDVGPAGVTPEPVVRDVVAAGPDFVTFSGDKLLGGPQAGIVVGRAEAVGRLRKHPLARAVRIDKLLLAGLQATLAAYLDPDRARREIPVLSMLFAPADEIGARAERFAARLREEPGLGGMTVEVRDAVSAVGGGSLPGEGVPTRAVVLDPAPAGTAARLERALRRGEPAVLARVQEDKVWLDLRTVRAGEEDPLAGALVAAAGRMR